MEDNTSGTTRSTKVDGQMCPTKEFEGVLPISEDEDELRLRISLLEPRGGTAIFTGAKWGISLLDPSIRPVIQNVDTVAAIHRETRPLDYPDATAEAEAKAPSYTFMVLMTDSQKSNVAGNSPRYDEGSEMRRLFDSDPTQHLTWIRNRSDDRLTSSQRQFKYYLRELAPHGPSNADPFSGGGAFFNVINTNVQDETEADRLSKGMCRTAKARDIVVYGIAAGATSNGETLMNCCASELKGIYYKQTSGADLDNIHAAVAEQLIDLRLTH
ncbi:hypothetical protein [Yoonia sediminilitoris]|uniref:Uncharacterized protein n=1 Tax=Yoonia sediminilitoris TaxID=1286148 RepID=A0A2T6KQE7_9RHOB|nr:hypothetical protein [Yoonia sediminilitoris]PUB18780.1 hypothetical protein C8N45_101367 [Yoonia sediminilitoris]RCW98948.1 hypothetical protein DFP92_101367 [Yoonia sediminilitoris]